METEEAKEIMKLYTTLIEEMSQHEKATVELWVTEIEATSEEKLKQSLVVRYSAPHPNVEKKGVILPFIRVNFDPLLLCLLREVKYFLQLKIEVPENALKIYSRGESFRQQTDHGDRRGAGQGPERSQLEQPQDRGLHQRGDGHAQGPQHGPAHHQGQRHQDARHPRSVGVLAHVRAQGRQGACASRNVHIGNASFVLKGPPVAVAARVHTTPQRPVLTGIVAQHPRAVYSVLLPIKARVCSNSRVAKMRVDRLTARASLPTGRRAYRLLSFTYAADEFKSSLGNLMETRYNDIADGGLEITKLLSLTNKTLKVSKGAPAWKAYVEFVNDIVIDGFSSAILSSVKYLSSQIDPDQMAKHETAPLLEIVLELEAPDIVWVPDVACSQTDKPGIRDLFNSWITSFVNIGNL
eukprot:7301695-Pyramimonas_sp.AAC.2